MVFKNEEPKYMENFLRYATYSYNLYMSQIYINITYKITKTISTFHCLRTNTKHLPLITLQFLHFRHVLNALRLYNFRCEFTTVCLQETTFIVFIATMCAPLQENSRQQRTI